MKRDILTIAVIFVVLGALGAFFFYAPQTEELSYHPIDVGGGSITVENQPDDLSTVTLDAYLAAPGWITIHESLSNAPAAIIGTSTYLEVGDHPGLVIQLSQPMSPGARYITLLHADNGDKVFVVNDDLPVEVNGEVVRPSFVAGREPGDDSTIVDIPGTDQSLMLEGSDSTTTDQAAQ